MTHEEAERDFPCCKTGCGRPPSVVLTVFTSEEDGSSGHYKMGFCPGHLLTLSALAETLAQAWMGLPVGSPEEE